MRLPRWLQVVFPYLLAVIALAYFGNFFWSLGMINQYGGSALQGSAQAGHYYLSEHGGSVEVSKAVWENLRLREIIFWATCIPGFGSFMLLLLAYVFPFIMGLRTGPEVQARVAAVRASGSQLARARCAGSIANVGLGFPVIVIEVYPAGLLVQYFLSPPIAILKSELRSVTRKRWGRLDIDHRSPDLGGVIIVRAGDYTGLDQALGQLSPIQEASAQR